MSTFQIMSNVESQAIRIEQAKAIYEEVGHYFGTVDEIQFLPYRANHILLLLHSADTLLHNALPELNRAVDELCEKNKKERRENQK